MFHCESVYATRFEVHFPAVDCREQDLEIQIDQMSQTAHIKIRYQPDCAEP